MSGINYKVREALDHYNEKHGTSMNIKGLCKTIEISSIPTTIEHTISMASKGLKNIPLKTLVAIADRLEVSVDYLLGREKDIHLKYKDQVEKICKINEDQMSAINDLQYMVHE